MTSKLIHEERWRFERDTGKEPKKVYLGWKNFRELMGGNWPYFNHNVDFTPRMQFCGMDVYTVDEKEYIAVGI